MAARTAKTPTAAKALPEQPTTEHTAEPAALPAEHFLTSAEAGELIAGARDAGGAQLLAALSQVARHAVDKEIRQAAARACETIAATGPETRIIPAAEIPRDPRPSMHTPKRRRGT